MQVFIYEHLVAHGWPQLNVERRQGQSLLREGAAMLSRLATDFSEVDGVQVATVQNCDASELSLPRQCRVHELLGNERVWPKIASLAVTADWTVVIAPETGGVLSRICRELRHAGARLLMPNDDFIEIASNKHETAQWLTAAGIRAPRGIALEVGTALPDDFPYPAVLKPRDGAGSEGVRLVRTSREVNAIARPSRLERFQEGLAASVAVLCGPAATRILPACEQRLSRDGTFQYRGGRLPLEPQLAERAARLAQQVVGRLPAALGYLGIDIVLGGDPAGTDDTVIEINPRLTTSYVGLSAALPMNLPKIMLLLAGGGSPGCVREAEPLEFEADGTIHFTAPTATP